MRNAFVKLLAGALLTSGVLAAPAVADQRREQDSAREEMRAGNVLKQRDIERIVVPQITRRNPNLQYLTFEWDEVARAYRFKFIDNTNGHIVWVDVDARNARILRIRE
ncbi:hypothetical protein GRI89_08035 [Altererythrobacter salegens]|uniref:PepSY domain-containing protein n=1 Tax=Croceibacterium salegens TaxID=1737568 RepID=A0A6I4SVW7_9SPHN|nr:hypothetical protein [Croceibacterium salegens]MXO59489.1 hypothetical protein [Croceibacterium salegens]